MWPGPWIPAIPNLTGEAVLSRNARGATITNPPTGSRMQRAAAILLRHRGYDQMLHVAISMKTDTFPGGDLLGTII